MHRWVISSLAWLISLGPQALGQSEDPATRGSDPGAGTLPDEVPADPNHPLMLDRTGIRWVAPFEAARAEAKRRGQLLLVNAIAFGTDASGNW